MKHIKGLLLSFKYAFSGIWSCVKNERNMRIHLVCMIYMYSFLGLTDWFVLTRRDWALIFLANAAVVMGELINTAVESVVDLVTEEKKPLAKLAKDSAAGAVLVGAIFAVCVGIAVLGQKEAFVKLFEYFSTHTAAFIIFILSFAAACVFMFLGLPAKQKGSSEK
ncbi:MAG: diacylglycerol kinase family protein [Acutalibacteraceae bacterium]